ncbi:MAG: hypothetical protein ACTSRK_18315 [Promethearchaeota archaeon]
MKEETVVIGALLLAGLGYLFLKSDHKKKRAKSPKLNETGEINESAAELPKKVPKLAGNAHVTNGPVDAVDKPRHIENAEAESHGFRTQKDIEQGAIFEEQSIINN